MTTPYSQRRFMCDLADARDKGYLATVPHFNSISTYLEREELTDVPVNLIERSAAPLAAVESSFAADSSGFTSCRFVRWFDHKFGVVPQEHGWVKAHIMCGVKTNVITAVEIKDRDASDVRQLPELLERTARRFTMSELSCDKGYSSVDSMNQIAKHGATPFIAFKSNASGRGSKGANPAKIEACGKRWTITSRSSKMNS